MFFAIREIFEAKKRGRERDRLGPRQKNPSPDPGKIMIPVDLWLERKSQEEI